MTSDSPTPSQSGALPSRKPGWRWLWHRYVTRRRILGADTIRCPDNAELEVHVQVSARNWVDALWTLRSFWHCVRQPFQLLVFCDPSLTEDMQARLRHRLPGADVIPTDVLSRAVRERFADAFPELYRLRTEPHFSTLPKLVDSFALRRHDVVITIEPDVLFFAAPTELLADLGSARPHFGRFMLPQFDADPRDVFCIDAAPVRELFGIELPRRFDCGLGSINYAAAHWEWAERVFKTVPPDPRRGSQIDRTLAWLLSERGGWQPLPAGRYVIEPPPSLKDVAARRYCGSAHDLFYSEGIAKLSRHGLLG